MIKSFNDITPKLKQVKAYDLYGINQYVQIRYKIFIKELGRPIIGEFYIDDLLAKHYILKTEHPIGTARIIYKDRIAEIGRIAILKEYRNQSYGAIIMHQILLIIKTTERVDLIRLFVERNQGGDFNKIEFYKKFGFIENGQIFFDNQPYVNMELSL